MGEIISRLFSNYLSEQTIAGDKEYSSLAKRALLKEKELREMLGTAETQCFEELFELTSQIHFLEVRDAFFGGCRMAAAASKELII